MDEQSALESEHERSPSLAVVEAVAAAADVDPADLHPPLYEAIDPIALDRLFADGSERSSNRSGRVTFTYRDYEVTVAADGTVTLA